MASAESILLDTNILVYASNADAPHHAQAVALRERARRGEFRACISLQNLSEFYAVITDPRRVTNPDSPEIATAKVREYLEARFIRKLWITPPVLRRMIALAEKYGVTRQNVFDTLLVATMIENEVYKIYTANDDDFNTYEEIVAVSPF